MRQQGRLDLTTGKIAAKARRRVIPEPHEIAAAVRRYRTNLAAANALKMRVEDFVRLCRAYEIDTVPEYQAKQAAKPHIPPEDASGG